MVRRRLRRIRICHKLEEEKWMKKTDEENITG
jgi:hypothetical protein